MARLIRLTAISLTSLASLASGARVLLAEDDDDLRAGLSAALGERGYDVVAVPSGKAVLERIGEAMLLEHGDGLPDVIITDVRMPGVTGMQILEGVRARGRGIPIVIISAFGDDETRDVARSMGATAFLDKPFDVGELESVLEAAVHR